ncbi:hypothetical protein CRUP_002376 [Coryphaenoides rupestris]|nr:hypothetical protein CRUP_002376 [Coryphaenoides rupestris]
MTRPAGGRTSWDSDRLRGSWPPCGSLGLCRMSCMAFLRPVRPDAMKSAYVASTSAILLLLLLLHPHLQHQQQHQHHPQPCSILWHPPSGPPLSSILVVSILGGRIPPRSRPIGGQHPRL